MNHPRALFIVKRRAGTSALFRAPGMGAIYRVKVPNHEGSSSG